MSYDTFWHMTPREFSRAYQGYEKEREEWFRSEWERARWMSSISASSWSKNPVQPKDLMTFPWEGDKSEDIEDEIKKLEEYRKWRTR